VQNVGKILADGTLISNKIINTARGKKTVGIVNVGSFGYGAGCAQWALAEKRIALSVLTTTIIFGASGFLILLVLCFTNTTNRFFFSVVQKK
jgi:hypothetical protein